MKDIIICTPNLSRIIKLENQSELPEVIKKLRKEHGTKRLQIFVRAYIIEEGLKNKSIL